MGSALDTMVFGSPDSCEAAANWLDRLANQTSAAADDVESALQRAAEFWYGPAYDAFTDTHGDMDDGFDSVNLTADPWAEALRDFAGTIRGVQNAMQGILDKAHSGGLTVNGPFIMAPENHLVPPQPSMANDTQIISDFQRRTDAYNAQVDAINVKIRLYNDLQDQVRDQRHTEGQAHYDLQQAMTTPADDVKNLQLSLTGAAGGRTVLSSIDGMYRDEMASVNITGKYGDALQKFPSGQAPTDDQMVLIKDAMSTEPQESSRVKAVQQWNKFNQKIPGGALRALSAPNGLDGPNSKLPQGLGKVLGGFSYVGSTLTVGTEALGAISGEQSWAQFGTNSTAEIGGGLIGGRLGSMVIGGITGGPFGAAAGGIVGGTAGGTFAKDLVTGWNQGMRQHEIDKSYAHLPEVEHKK